MFEILCVDDARAPRTPVVDGDGARVGTVVDADGDLRYVTVHPDAPADALDALDWRADADRVPLPAHLVAADDDGVVRLAV